MTQAASGILAGCVEHSGGDGECGAHGVGDPRRRSHEGMACPGLVMVAVAHHPGARQYQASQRSAAPTMHRYTAYGLNILATHPIPELIAVDGSADPDITITIGARPGVQDDSQSVIGAEPVEGSERRVYRSSPSGMVAFCYSDGTEFFIAPSGDHIWAIWRPPYTVEDMATYLLGPILGYVLRLRQTVALHASSVAVDGRAIAFVGGPGAGKSTTAACFALRGFSVLSDDVSAIDHRHDGFSVRPAYPHLRLWPASVASLLGGVDALRPITPNWDKRDFPLLEHRAFATSPLPLAALFILGDRRNDERAPYAEPVSPREGFIHLVGNTYGNTLLDPPMRAHEFDVLTRMCNEVPIRRVIPHESRERIGAICDTILDDLERHGAAHKAQPA